MCVQMGEPNKTDTMMRYVLTGRLQGVSLPSLGGVYITKFLVVLKKAYYAPKNVVSKVRAGEREINFFTFT